MKLLVIISATPLLFSTLTGAQHNNFEPIPANVARQHFNIDQRRQSGHVRFPVDDEEDEVFKSSFQQHTTERRFAQPKEATLLTDFQRLLQSVASTTSSPSPSFSSALSRPLSLEESFSSVRQNLRDPSTNPVQQSFVSSTNSKQLSSRTQNSLKIGSSRPRSIQNVDSSFKTKVITNPLLKKLFNKDRISVSHTFGSSPGSVKPISKALGSKFVQSTSRQNVLTTTTTATLKPKPTTATAAPAVSKLQPHLQQQSQKQSQQSNLLVQIKKKIYQDGSPSEEDLMNALIEKRVEEELARRKKLEEDRVEFERQKLLAQANREQQQSSLTSIVKKASDAVNERISTGSDKATPAIWAAVRALRNFVVSRKDPKTASNIPEPVLVAVTQLTKFLMEEDSGVSEQQEGESVKQIETFMQKESRLPNLVESEHQFGKKLLPQPVIKIPSDPSDNLRTFRFSTLPV